MTYLMWLLKAAIFFTLFAFALNNQQIAAVYFFFGTVWKAPLVLVVLTSFGCGLALGILLMMPRWWKKRRAARMTDNHASRPAATGPTASAEPSGIPHGL